jgi:putative PIN family toxin of toxin-antitoxin system
MRLVVLDTNVIVSAGLKMGSIPYRLVMDWVLEDKVHLVTCPSIIDEYREVLWRPKFTRHGFPPVWLAQLIDASLQLPDPAPWPHPAPDPKDAPLLVLASAAGAWLVTGNLKHFPESARAGVAVLSPAEYLAHLGEESPEIESM